jgi:uncharacterized membrane protein SpoIIM required for sporulation
MLEQLYPIKIVEKKPYYAFILGLAYSIIGIGIAVLLFPEDPAIVAVALISLMFYPTLKKLLALEEKEEAKNLKFNLIDFFKDHQYIFKVYILFFLGAMLGFAFFTISLPSLAANHIFNNQVDILYRITGAATFNLARFGEIFANNIVVLILVFVTAFLIGDGAIFLLTWNASVWGTIFGLFAKNYALSASKNPFYVFLVVITIVITHTLLEAFAYISAASAGGVISKGMVKERLASTKFNRVVKGTLITLLFAILVLIVAVAVENYVLGNIKIYQEIVRYSFI